MSVINFSGIASGIDTAGLIEATSDAARQTKVKPSQKKVSELQETNSAMEDLNKKLESLKSLLRGFSTLNGGGVSKTGTSSKESVVTATATNGAANGSYDVTVNTLAKNHIYTFDQTFSSADQALQSSLTGLEAEADRTVTFTVGTGTNTETVNIVITDGAYSVGDFVNAFNLKSSKSEASLVNVGTSASPSYKILISSNYEGTEKGTISRTALGTSLTNLTAYSESAAVNASLTISGLGTLTRPTNSVADVLPGVTLSLVSTGSATVKVAEDPTTTGSKVQEFVDSYNEIVKFLEENNQIARDESGTEVKNVFGPLASTRTDDNALNALRTALSGAVATGGSTIRIFPDIGITTERDGSLKFDSAKFQAAVSAEPSSVSSILTQFADTTSLTGGTIDIYTRFNGLIDVTLNGNKTLITDLNTRIADAERAIAKQAEDMKARFARLESLMGRLQQQQSSLSSALAGLR